MITRTKIIRGEYYVIRDNGDLRRRGEFYGKSYDSKPINGVNNADLFYEMDTRKVFLYDEDGKTWIEQ